MLSTGTCQQYGTNSSVKKRSNLSHIVDRYRVDDACPEQSGLLVKETCHDPRVKILFHAKNQGVGGACITGMKAAIKDGASVMVKVDGDGQMDPALIPQIVHPILNGTADYAKGNRYYTLSSMSIMLPKNWTVG